MTVGLNIDYDDFAENLFKDMVSEVKSPHNKLYEEFPTSVKFMWKQPNIDPYIGCMWYVMDFIKIERHSEGIDLIGKYKEGEDYSVKSIAFRINYVSDFIYWQLVFVNNAIKDGRFSKY